MVTSHLVHRTVRHSDICSKTMLSLQQGDEVLLSCAIQVNFKMQLNITYSETEQIVFSLLTNTKDI